MKFKDLAWGAFLYANANRGTYGERIYDKLVSDIEFLKRLQDNPSISDFEEIRDFVAHFGVRFIPKNFAEAHLTPIWPARRPNVQALARESLETVNLSDPAIRHALVGVFEWPYWVWGGDTVKSKVLHFFNIHLFVMWDDEISGTYVGAEGYLEFLKQMQTEAREVIVDFQKLYPSSHIESFLSEKLGYGTHRPLTKFIDQYNWITITKGWPNSLPSWLIDLYMERNEG